VDFVMCGARMFQKGFCFGGRSQILCAQFYFLFLPKITKKPYSFKTLITTMFLKQVK